MILLSTGPDPGDQGQEPFDVVQGGLGRRGIARQEQVEAVLGAGKLDINRRNAGLQQLAVQGAGDPRRQKGIVRPLEEQRGR
jgi:hypothetical protein